MDLLSEILAMGGSSLLVGFLVGLFIRALSKVLALMAGAFMLGLLMLSYYGIIMINYQALGNAIYSLFEYLGSLALSVTAVPFFLGLTLGWAVAPRKGRKRVESYV